MKRPQRPALRTRRDARTVLDRILEAPHLEHVIPRLQPELFHRVIQACGLEDCGELVMLATPEQIMRIFDLDLWRSVDPGMDEQFDAARFGLWIEVLAQSGADAAAQKLTQLDADLVIAGLVQHARVFDTAAATPYRTTDGDLLPPLRHIDDEFACEIGSYLLVAKRTDSWHAIVDVLISLDVEYPDYFHRVMRGCRSLSNSAPEVDGLDDLLDSPEQAMFDLIIDREDRRDAQGYVTPAQARAFLQTSRSLNLKSQAPPADPVIGARRASTNANAVNPDHELGGPQKLDAAPNSDQSAQATAAFIEILLDAGILPQHPRALLSGGSDKHGKSLERIRAYMQLIFDSDSEVYANRSEELTYIANALMAGCSVQGRPFTTQEAWDTAVAACNLGLENWPALWAPAKNLVTVFQVGWTVLHNDVSMYAAERLQQVLTGFECVHAEVQAGISRLRMQLSKNRQAGTPWRARKALDVVAMLDVPACVALAALLGECPVLHDAAGASGFEFISENRQIEQMRKFLYALPGILRGRYAEL